MWETLAQLPSTLVLSVVIVALVIYLALVILLAKAIGLKDKAYAGQVTAHSAQNKQLLVEVQRLHERLTDAERQFRSVSTFRDFDIDRELSKIELPKAPARRMDPAFEVDEQEPELPPIRPHRPLAALTEPVPVTVALDPSNPPVWRRYRLKSGNPKSCHCHGRQLNDGEEVLLMPDANTGAVTLLCRQGYDENAAGA